jgi:DNA mismatch endonuclease, patch repair protein
MTDKFDAETRSRIMASVKQKNTAPEIAIRKELHARGFRYRLHSHGLRGRPDFVLAKFRAVVFVHGCFWHRHEGCRYATTPSTRAEFWQAKFKANVVRDSAIRVALLEAGWRVATIWECYVRKPEQVTLAADRLSAWLLSETDTLELGELDKATELKGPN